MKRVLQPVYPTTRTSTRHKENRSMIFFVLSVERAYVQSYNRAIDMCLNQMDLSAAPESLAEWLLRASPC